MIDEIPIAALNHYDYCPYRCYLMYVAFEFQDNVFTVEGLAQHERVNTPGQSSRGDVWQFRSVWLRSERYGLIGKADLIEEKDGRIYPVEYKRGSKGDWKNDQLQLCAQALCLEEMLNLSHPIERGFIYYALTHQREEVPLTPELREQTIETIARVRELLTTRHHPPAIYTKRCHGCSLYSICLPKEMDRARRHVAVLREED